MEKNSGALDVHHTASHFQHPLVPSIVQGQPGLPDGEPVSHPRSVAGSGEDDRSHRESLPGAGDTANNAWCGTSVKGIEPEFSDEPLFVPGCRDEGLASRISRSGLYGIDAASNVCALM